MTKMKTKIKRNKITWKEILSIILIMLIISLSTPVIKTASAASVDDAINWIESQLGKYIDYDGEWGAQCVDFIMAYYIALGVSPVGGNAVDYTTNSLPTGWSRIQGAQPQPGDILVYTGNTYGHVGIMGKNGAHYHQNIAYSSYPNGGSPVVKITSWGYTAFTSVSYWGVVRPNFNSTPSYYIDVNMNVNGSIDYDFTNVTFDMYINGSRVADDVKDYYTRHPSGTRYEVKDIKVSGCYKYDGTGTDRLSGTVGSRNIIVDLKINTSHNWGGWTKLNDTQHQRVCSRDSSHKETANHAWNSGSITTAPTCTADGVKTYTCSVCSATKTEGISALGHDFIVTGGSAGSCLESGTVTYTCKKCGTTQTLGSDWTSWAVDPPPAGVYKSETKTQYRYSDRQTTTSSNPTLSGWTQTGKSYSAWGSWSSWSRTAVSESDTKQVEKAALYRYACFKCTNCGMRDPYSGDCSNCGQNSLVWNETWSPIAYKDSQYQMFGKPYTTILGDGLRWYFSIGNLNDTAIGTKDTDSDAVVIEQGYRYRTRTVTYTFERWTDFSDWSDTVYTASADRKVETRILYRYMATEPAVGAHSWNSGTVTTAPTCTAAGVKTFTCTVCSATKTEAVEALGHSYGAWTKLNDTQHQRVCSRDASHVEKENHTWDAGKVTREPAVGVAGEKTYTCTVCKATKTEVIPPIDDPMPANPDAVLEIASATTQAGKTVTLDVYITKAAPINFMRLSLRYDTAALTLQKAENSGLFDTFDQGVNLMFSTDGDVNVTGKLVTLTFLVNENAPAGEYPITLLCRECYSADEKPVSVAIEDGIVTVQDFVLGDVNGDGVVDGRDLVRLRKYLANLDETTGTSNTEIFAGAEVTGDSKVDGRDLIRLRKYLANYDEDTGTSTVTLG